MRTLMAGLLAFSLGGLALADDDKKPEAKKPETRAEKLKAIQDEMTAPSKTYQKELKEAKTDEEKKAAREKFSKAMIDLREQGSKFAERAMALAKEDPKDEVGLNALMLVYQNSAQERTAAAKLIVEHHPDSQQAERMLMTMTSAAATDEKAKAFVEEVIEKSDKKSLKATALLGLGNAIKRKAAPYSGPPPADLDELLKTAAGYYERVIKEMADVAPANSKTTYGAMAKSALAGLKNIPNLQIGKTAPDIEGVDTDGKPFKLSDYRGKVVVLDFWGHW